MSDELLPSDQSPDSAYATPATLDPEKQQYLQYLAIGHYVMAVLAFLFGSIPLLHIVFGIAVAVEGVGTGSGQSLPIAGLTFGLVLIFFGLVFVLSAWAYGIFMIKAAKALKEHRNHLLCMVMAAVSCIFAPVGTVLGIFTLLLLLDGEVKAAFGR